MSEPVFLPRTCIHVAATEIFLPVVTAFVEHSAEAMGLEHPEALKIMLAAEELFLHLCGVIIPQRGIVEIRCSRIGSFVQCDFLFPETRMNMHAFNVTASPRGVSISDMNEMRLILASRSVDRFDIRRKEKMMQISLIKEKKYPAIVPTQENPPVVTCREFEMISPSLDELKLFAWSTASRYRENDLQVYYKHPGMLADIVQYGRGHAVIARGPSGEIGGGMVWYQVTEKMVIATGPYVLVADDGVKPVADALIECCIQEAGRTSAVVMICYPPESIDIGGYFEYLGHINRYNAGGHFLWKSSWFRLIQEDMGCVVWTTPELEGFLRDTYHRLFLARDIHHVTDIGDTRDACSVFSTQIDRQRYQARLDLIWPGRDIDDNLRRHLDLFHKDNIRDVIFEIDIGVAWKSAIMPLLLKNGFQPVFILPYTGQGDVLVFQFIQRSS